MDAPQNIFSFSPVKYNCPQKINFFFEKRKSQIFQGSKQVRWCKVQVHKFLKKYSCYYYYNLFKTLNQKGYLTFLTKYWLIWENKELPKSISIIYENWHRGTFLQFVKGFLYRFGVIQKPRGQQRWSTICHFCPRSVHKKCPQGQVGGQKGEKLCPRGF